MPDRKLYDGLGYIILRQSLLGGGGVCFCCMFWFCSCGGGGRGDGHGVSAMFGLCGLYLVFCCVCWCGRGGLCFAIDVFGDSSLWCFSLICDSDPLAVFLFDRNCLRLGWSSLVGPEEWPKIGLLNRGLGSILLVSLGSQQNTEFRPRRLLNSYFRDWPPCCVLSDFRQQRQKQDRNLSG